MKALFVSVALGVGFLLSVGAYAEAPAGATAQCKDGTYFSGATHKGACRGHKGVQTWLDAGAAPAAAAPAAAADDATSKKSKKPKTTEAAAAPATSTATTGAAPAGAIAQCKDGTSFSGTSHKGACRGHKGVQTWLDGSAAPAVTAAPAAAAPAAAATTMAAPAAATAATPAAAATGKHTPPTPASQITQKAGGGPGLVWVNSSSKVYHCQGDEWYGKTKEGSYMTEAAATAAGNHADHGKTCAK